MTRQQKDLKEKKAVPAKQEKPAIKEERRWPRYVCAGQCSAGTWYVNQTRSTALTPTGRSARPGDYWPDELEFRAETTLGDRFVFGLPAESPVMEDEGEAARVRAECERRCALQERRAAKGEVVVGKDGEETVVGRAAAQPRAAMDPRTGCTPGTAAHRAGEVMLSVKAGPEHRRLAIEALMKEMGMQKGLASSWYSTHLRRRPEIYGKLCGK